MKAKLFWVVLHLFVGLLVSLVISWIIIRYQFATERYVFRMQPKVQAESRFSSEGHAWAIRYWSDPGESMHVIERSGSFYDKRKFGKIVQLQSKITKIPAWSKARVAPVGDETRSVLQRLEVAAGWPFIAWYGEYYHENQLVDSREVHGAFLHERSGLMDYPFVFPFIPMRVGFVQNFLFYSLLSLLVHLGFAFILERKGLWVERRRSRRGQCIFCKYDIIGLEVCPECGHAV